MASAQPQEFPLLLPAFWPLFGEARGDHDKSVNPLRCAVQHHIGYGVGGHHNNREIDVVRDVGDVGVCGQS